MKLSGFNNKGFAPIVLVVLLLFGIAAGVILIQNGVNFLPKAQEAWNPPNDGVIRIKFETVCYTDTSGDNVRNFQRKGPDINDSLVAYCDVINRPCSNGVKEFCGQYNMQCARDNDFEAHCVPRKLSAPEENNIFDCNPEDINTNNHSQCPNSGQIMRVDRCVHKSNPSGKIIGDDCLNLNDSQNQTYYCYWDKQCSTSQQAAAPARDNVNAPAAAAPAPLPGGEANGISATPCSTALTKACQDESWQPKGGCVITTTGLRQCKYEPSREGDKCNNDSAHPETGAACGNTECRIIDGLPRCITDKCTSTEISGCRSKGATCEIGEKSILGEVKKYTYCKPATTGGGPATGSGPTGGDTTGAPGTTAGGGAKPETASSGCEEFKDGNDLGIPCFKIGVFTPEDLKATEADAKIALTRYDDFNKILNEVKEKISTEITEAATKKTAAAEAAANKCINKQ